MKQARVHALEPGALLVKSAVDRAALTGILVEAGIGRGRPEELPYADWWLVSTGDSVSDPQAVRARVKALLSNQDVQFAGPVMTGELEGTWFAPMPQLLLQFTDGAAQADIDAALIDVPSLEAIQPLAVDATRWHDIPLASRNGFDVLDLANRLAPLNSVVFAEPNMIMTGRHGETPNDPLFSLQWNLDNVGQTFGTPGIDMDAEIAWNGFPPGGTPEVMVIDDGVQLDHPDLAGKITAGGDFSTGVSLPGGGPVGFCDRHGTAVAGTIAAVKNNGIGVAGLAETATIATARCFIADPSCNGSWTTQTNSTVLALDWGVVFGISVTNNSNSYGFTSGAIASKYQQTRDVNGIIHFASAGNNSGGPVAYPAILPSVNAISAIDANGSLASFSNVGPAIEFTGPGVAIPTTDRTGSNGYVSGDYVTISGTSFSSPLCAAVAAQYIAYHSQIGFPASFPTPGEIETAMRNGALDLGAPGKDDDFGWGLPSSSNASLVDGYAAYGNGTPGCESPLTFFAELLPRPGIPMQFYCNNGPPGSTAFNLLSLGQESPGVVIGGTNFLVEFGPPFLFITQGVADANGDALVSVPIPNNPSLIGLKVYSQWAFSLAGTPCAGSANWSSSNGIEVTIQP